MDCLAANLVKMRKAKGLSQEQLAKLVGVSRGTVAKYETAVGGITTDTITRLSEVLGCEETDLTGDPALRDQRVNRLESLLKKASVVLPEMLELEEKRKEAFTQLSPDAEEVLHLWSHADTGQRECVLAILRRSPGVSRSKKCC